MFAPSGDQSSPSAWVAIEVSLCVPVALPDVGSKSAIQICDPPSLVDTNANRFPSGAQRGRSASCSEMSARDSPPAVGTIHTWGVLELASRLTSTTLNSTHLPSGEGTGSPTRLSDIMSSKVNGCLLWANHEAANRRMKREKENDRRRIRNLRSKPVSVNQRADSPRWQFALRFVTRPERVIVKNCKNFEVRGEAPDG